MSEQNPYGAPQQPGYPATPPPAAPGYGGVPAQPGYDAAQQPGYPGAYPGYGGAYAPVPPPKRSRKGLWITLGTIGAVVVIGGGALAYFVYDATSNAGTQKIVLPANFKDTTRNDDNPVSAAMEKAMTDSLGKGDGNWKPTGVAGVYQNSSSEPDLIVAGAYGKVLMPKKELDAAFDGVSSKGSEVTDRHSVDAGPKGGEMECANVTQTDTPKMGICAWADSSSLVMVMKVPQDENSKPDLDKLAADTRDLRAVSEVPK